MPARHFIGRESLRRSRQYFMNRFALLAVSALAPMLAQADPPDFPAGFQPGYPLYGDDVSGHAGVPPGNGRALSPPVPARTQSPSELREGGRLWVPASPPAPVGRAPSEYPTDHLLPGVPADRQPGLFEQFRPTPGSYEASPGWPGTLDGVAGPTPYGPDGTAEYRFRNGDRFRSDPGGAATWHRGYRFRPLTEQERGRGIARPGWRPLQADPQPPAQGPPPSLPELQDAYGYREDGWFGRYFGNEGR
jgi:hypothetical protein